MVRVDRHAGLGGQALELAEFQQARSMRVKRHVPHRPMAGLARSMRAGRRHRFIGEARGEVAEVDVKERPSAPASTMAESLHGRR